MTIGNVPAWLDLDTIVSPALREEMQAIAERIEEYGVFIDGLAHRAIAARDAFHDEIHAAGADEILDALGVLSGFDRLFEAWMALAGRACDVTECVPV